MLKFNCDKCKNEFDPGDLFVEGKFYERKHIISKMPDGKEVINTQKNQMWLHLCPTCTLKLKEWLETKDKK